MFYILYSTRQNLISSNSFSLNHGSNVWLFLWFNRSVQKCLRNSDYYIFILPCFFLAAKSQYISWILLNVWTYLLWFTGGLSQKSSGSSSVHKVYCEFRVWLFDNNTFRQDSIFVTTGFPIVISIYVPSTPSLWQLIVTFTLIFKERFENAFYMNTFQGGETSRGNYNYKFTALI